MWFFFLVKFEENSSFLLRSVADIFPEFTTCEMKENLEYGDFYVDLTFELFKCLTLIKHFNGFMLQPHHNFDKYREIDGVIELLLLSYTRNQVFQKLNVPYLNGYFMKFL